MRLLNSLDALDADKDGGHYKSETDDDGRNRLRVFMPVWVFFVGGLDCKLEQYDCGAHNIGERFNAICNQSKSVAQKSGHTFEYRQRQI